MRTHRWILLAALALPATTLAQVTQPGSQTGTKPGTRPAEPGTRAGTQAGTKPGTPQTGEPTAAEQAGQDVILNPINPIGDDAQTEAARNPTVTPPPVGETGVNGVGDLGQGEEDVFGTNVDPFSEPNGLTEPNGLVAPNGVGLPTGVGAPDRIGNANPLGNPNPLNPPVNPLENDTQRDELDPLSE